MINTVVKQGIDTVVHETKLPFEASWKNGWLEYRNISRLYILNACAMGLLYLAIHVSQTWLGIYLLSGLTSLVSAEIAMLLFRNQWVRVVIAKGAIKISEKDQKHLQSSIKRTLRLEAFLLVPITVGLCFLVMRPFLANLLPIRNLMERSREYRFAFDGFMGLVSYMLWAIIRNLITRSALATLREFEQVSMIRTSRTQSDPRTGVSCE